MAAVAQAAAGTEPTLRGQFRQGLRELTKIGILLIKLRARFVSANVLQLRFRETLTAKPGK